VAAAALAERPQGYLLPVNQDAPMAAAGDYRPVATLELVEDHLRKAWSVDNRHGAHL
jgi:hypothetical protein